MSKLSVGIKRERQRDKGVKGQRGRGVKGYGMGAFQLIFVLMLFLSFSSGVRAQSFFRERVGTTGAQFLKIGTSARAAGMNSAYAALGDDAGAVFQNPAGSYLSKRKELTFMRAELFQGITLHTAYYLQPLAQKKGTIILNYTIVDVGDIQRTVITGIPNPTFNGLPVAVQGTFTARDQAFTLSYSNEFKLWKQQFLWGTNFKIIYQKLDVETSSGVAMDFGGMWLPHGNQWRFGAVIQNVGFLSKFRQESDPLPLAMTFSAGRYFFNHRLGIDADFNFPSDNAFNLELGAEGWIFPFLAARGGWRYDNNSTDRKAFSFGAGFRYQNFQLDYAFVPFTNLGNAHRFSGTFRFGGEKKREFPALLVSNVLSSAAKLSRGAGTPSQSSSTPLSFSARDLHPTVLSSAAKLSRGTGTPSRSSSAPLSFSSPPVRFRLYAPQAQRVSLVGDFNNWISTMHPMKKNMEGLWEIRANLSPGKHHYKFMVDGVMKTDPSVHNFENDEIAGLSNIYRQPGTPPKPLYTGKPYQPFLRKDAPHLDGQGRVVFTLSAPEASVVSLVGDFTKWSMTTGLMRKRADGRWILTVPLSSGRHHYYYLVDGKRWADPANPYYRKTLQGWMLSIIKR